MNFTASNKFCWYNDGRKIVKMYFLNDVPFTFDELPDGHLYDRDLIDIANTNPEYEMEDVYKGSNYLIMEQCHPCFDVIEILNSEILPDDLIYSVDEEDFHG